MNHQLAGPGRVGVGQTPPDVDAYPCLAPEATFDFACKGCGDCCRQRRDLVLSGLDLYRIARRLALPPALVASAFCKAEIGQTGQMYCLPVLRLAPRGKNADCPFLDGGSCAIHAARPLACALYPLGQAIDPATGKAEYYPQTPLCGASAGGRSLAQYLQDAGVAARLGTDVQWAKACTQISGLLQAAGGAANPHFLPAVRRTEKALYYDYTVRDEFYPQFRQNMEVLLPLLARILG
ncbi:MAG: YkgJ family cysteine cluster protein [Gemmiger sp.]|nr:YkgJ family cysteine cluster protein [Gemmiger sp.]